MADTARYCTDCYYKVAVFKDPRTKAAEKAGKMPTTQGGYCSVCNSKTIVIFYEESVNGHLE